MKLRTGVRPTEQTRRETNRAAMRAYARKWRRAHPEQTRAHSKKCRAKNRDKIREYQRRWAAKNSAHLKAKQRAWYLANRERILRERTEAFFNLPKGSYTILLSAQNSRCLICGCPPGARQFAVDHDHATGAIRGLLCGPCNAGIGLLRDDPALLLRAAQYLRDRKTTDLRESAKLPETEEPRPCL